MPHMTDLVMTHEQVRERLPEYAASAAAEPPPEPPGMRPRSHGLLVGP